MHDSVTDPIDTHTAPPADPPPSPPPPPPDDPPPPPPSSGGEPAWGTLAREAGWAPPSQQPAAPAAGPTPAAVAVSGAPGGTATGTLTQGGYPATGLVPTGVPPNAQPGVDENGVYRVQPGESLALIAERFGHPGEWRAIHGANFDSVYDPNVIAPGQELTIPPEWLSHGEPEPERPA